jgi:hypothetical protein
MSPGPGVTRPVDVRQAHLADEVDVPAARGQMARPTGCSSIAGIGQSSAFQPDRVDRDGGTGGRRQAEQAKPHPRQAQRCAFASNRSPHRAPPQERSSPEFSYTP